MRSIFEKKWVNSTFTQMLVVVVAFTILCVSNYFFVSNNEQKHLITDAESALGFAEARINAIFLENETFLTNFSRTIQSMIYRNLPSELVLEFMDDISGFFVRDNQHMEDFITSFAYFFNLDRMYIPSARNIPDADFNPREQPWFKAALEGNGNIVITEPGFASRTGRIIITLSRCIADDDGEPLAIICMNVDLSRIIQTAVTIDLTDTSYGLLLNKDLRIIAHPQSDLIGQFLYNVNSHIASLSTELEAGKNINEYRVKNYRSDDSIVYFRKISYNWILGIVIPVHEYYSSTYNMAVFIFLLGAILSLVMCGMLYQISKAKMKADLRTQQKSNFLATMSHEIRTPLNAILGMTEIQMRNTDHPPSTSETFIMINNSGNLLLNIINDILDLSKIESGKIELVPVKYNVSRLINDIVQLNHIRYESKSLEFILEVDENIPAVLVGDELRIKQILNNLLSNAFKYTDSGKVVLSVSSESVSRGGGHVHVTLIFHVTDTGHGMTAEQLDKLYDEYTRFNMEANRTTEGTGLGMTITRNLVNLMNGKISVKSTVGKGTVVSVLLPQKTDGVGIRGIIGAETAEKLRQFKQGNGVHLKKSQIKYEYMPYGKVLIVDDVETNLYVAKGLLTPYGLKIDLATSGFEAIDKVKAGNIYDIIFMDHMMPKMDGIETTKRLRERGYTGSIVALTANALAGQAEVFLNCGFDEFVSKPIDIRQLNFIINKLIRDKKPIEVIEDAQKERAEQEKNLETAHQQIDPQLAEIFTRDAKKAIAVLETSMRNNLASEDDIQIYVINTHAMKSALANIGITDLSNTARRLEQAGREKDINVMVSETQDFINALNKVIDEIKPEDAETETIEDTEESLAYLRENLETIKEACASFDKKTIKGILKELREKPWSQDTKKILDTLAEHLLHSDFENAASIADEYIKKITI